MRRVLGTLAGAAGIAAGTAAATAAVVRAGAEVQPDPFPDLPEDSGPPHGEVAVPPGLPEPVDRWMRGIYGDRVPVVGSVVVTGRARVKPFGFWLPARFRFVHDAGRGYRHYIEATLFGRPVLAVQERYLDGRSLMEIPVVGTDQGPQVDQAANLGMWAELAMAAPSVLLTDSRVSWHAIDAETAQLDVPFGAAARDSFTVRFDPATGALRSLETWRYRSSTDPEKILWIAAIEPGPTVGPWRLPAVGTATWADQGEPWARFVTEDLRTDVDVSDYIRARGI
jgi:hypothetical protein